jgi:hypothetical protein
MVKVVEAEVLLKSVPLGMLAALVVLSGIEIPFPCKSISELIPNPCIAKIYGFSVVSSLMILMFAILVLVAVGLKAIVKVVLPYAATVALGGVVTEKSAAFTPPIVIAPMFNVIFPKLFIVEYNAKFPPPIRWQIEYNCDHIWQSDDYFGASLSSFNDLFVKYEYQLICCNLFTGANAFFIKKEFANLFNEVPKKIEDIYCRPRYYLYNFSNKASNKIIEKLFN